MYIQCINLISNLNKMTIILTILIVVFSTLLLSIGYIFFDKKLIGSCSNTGKLCLCDDVKRKECEKLIDNKI